MEDIENLFDGEFQLSVLAEYFNRFPDVLFFAAAASGPWDEMTVLEIITFAEYLKKYYSTEV